ncbi:MAG: zinc ribbon domain-containing protein [Candidatus Caldarchaeum sp.]
MNHLLKLASAALASFAIIFLLSTLEFTAEQPIQLVVAAVVLAAVAAGFAGRSPFRAAVGVLIGGAAAFTLAYFWGVRLWSPSPVPSDLPVVRMMLIGGTALLAAGVGLVASEIISKPKPSGLKEEKPKPVKQPVVELEVVKKEVRDVVQEPGNRVCKFCESVIPAESVFCPMCGAKLVEAE